ncbi:hypothetical protein GC170_18530 [bacterium]|nr:hypothetical protein [bacterium]
MAPFHTRLTSFHRHAISTIATANPLVMLPLQIYGPFLAVGVFMAVHDDCMHCRKAFFEAVLILPGVVMSAILTRLTSRSFAPNVDPVAGGIAVVLTFAVVVGISRALPESARRAFGWIVVVPVFLLEAILCRALIAM